MPKPARQAMTLSSGRRCHLLVVLRCEAHERGASLQVGGRGRGGCAGHGPQHPTRPGLDRPFDALSGVDSGLGPGEKHEESAIRRAFQVSLTFVRKYLETLMFTNRRSPTVRGAARCDAGPLRWRSAAAPRLANPRCQPHRGAGAPPCFGPRSKSPGSTTRLARRPCRRWPAQRCEPAQGPPRDRRKA